MIDQSCPLYTILCVGTGNVGRSPVAERLLASRLRPEVTITSAGTFGLIGQPIEPDMGAYLNALGATDAGFASRRLSAGDVRRADLVLGMTREHRSAAVDLVPAAVRRAFTLREFARLLAEVDPAHLPDTSVADRLRAGIPLAAARRRRVLGALGADDVMEPDRGLPGGYAQTFLTIRTAVDTIAERVRPHSGLSLT